MELFQEIISISNGLYIILSRNQKCCATRRHRHDVLLPTPPHIIFHFDRSPSYTRDTEHIYGIEYRVE